MKTRSLSYLTA